jgi:hypothetical protein
VRTNGHSLAQLELGNGFTRLGHDGLLSGDQGEVFDGAFDRFALFGGLANTRVHHDLHQTRHLVRVGVAELFGQRGDNFLAVLFLQPGQNRRFNGTH